MTRPPRNMRQADDDAARAVLPLTPVAMNILLALVDEDRHGLGIAEHVDSFTSGRMVLGPGTLYGAMKRLLDLGLVDEADRDSAGGADDPRRRYYSITRVGRRALELETRDLEKVLRVARTKKVL
jgi:DNA-binding PadR family transcriptional regulator